MLEERVYQASEYLSLSSLRSMDWIRCHYLEPEKPGGLPAAFAR
jgi:hypothetical protein